MAANSTHMTATNPFWQFSLALYEQPGIADLCLALQEDSGADVNLLLYALWRASREENLPPQSLAMVEAATAQWRDQVVRPLRAVRQQLRAMPAFVASSDQLLRVELGLERHQQDLMHACQVAVERGYSVHDSLQHNLGVLWQHGELPESELPRVLERVSEVLRSGTIDLSAS